MSIEAIIASQSLELLSNLSNKGYIDDILKNIKNILIQRIETREQQISNLKNAYKERNLVLVLGAGISSDYGLPDWNILLQKLSIKTFEDETPESEKESLALSRLFTKLFSPSPLIFAKYLRNYYEQRSSDFENDLKFENAVRKVIYGSLDMNRRSDLFREIRQLCIAPGNSPNLNCIITYNYDDILEQYLSMLDIDFQFKSIYTHGSNLNQNEFPIYHVHGFLPQNGKLISSNKIILSEDIYHQQYLDVYNWNNLIQINKFIDCKCLFIGVSLTDPNLRRLLDISMKLRGESRGHNYLFKKKYDLERLKQELKKLLKMDKDLYNTKRKANLSLDDSVLYLTAIMEKFEEQDALSLGIEIIWINNYGEIPEFLREIRTVN